MKAKRILWIDDDADLLMGLIRPLEKNGHEIVVVKDEKEALETIKKLDFDLIILDIIIPTGIKGDKGDVHFIGMRLLEKLLVDLEIGTPVIVLSVMRDPEMITKMYDLGVEKVLQKGKFLPSKLRDEVYETLGVQE
jgi:CheY-like chemotaxis protein